MDQHEPVFIRSTIEILHHIDIVETDRAVRVESRPIVQDIAAVRQERRLIDTLGQRHHRPREIGGQGGRCFALAPDIGLDQKAVAHHRHAHLLLRCTGRPVCQIKRWQTVQPVPDPAGRHQPRQIVCCFQYGRKYIGKVDFRHLEMRKKSAGSGHIII